jgi:hypothetical protein
MAILQAYELRQLNTKLAVEYDPVTTTILSIRGLRERSTPSGLRTFRIDATTSRTTTQKQVRGKAAAGATPSGSVLNELSPIESKE